MKFMKIALSVVAIAAIATIYGTGAFVSQTHGLNNTVDGFLVISNAEMAQQVGGVQPREGIQDLVEGDPVPNENDYCVKDNGCAQGKKNKKKEITADHYECTPCKPPVNIYNLIPINFFNRDFHWPKHSRFKPNGNRVWVPAKLIISCHKNHNGKCELHTQLRRNGPQFNSCEERVEVCD